MRHAVLAHGDFDLHARVVDVAQHLDHAPHRLHVAVRVFDDLDADHLPHLGLALRVGRDQDVWLMRLSSGATTSTPPSLSRRPITRRLARSVISTIWPSGRPRRS